VYIATTAQSGAPNRTDLEFEDTGANPVRYTRRVDGPLLEALHTGAPVSRARLQDELEAALMEAGAADPGSPERPTVVDPADADGAHGQEG
jgi:hypothetical protein